MKTTQAEAKHWLYMAQDGKQRIGRPPFSAIKLPLFLLVLLSMATLAVTSSHRAAAVVPLEAQDAVQILCYAADASRSEACQRLDDLGAQQDPAWDITRATAGVLPRNLTDFEVLYLETDTGDSLDGSLEDIRSYLDNGGSLLLTDPDFGVKLGRALQAPRAPRTVPSNPTIEFTRAAQLTPGLRELNVSDMPANSIPIALNTLGSGWTPQAKLVEQGNVTLAISRYGQGRILLSPIAVEATSPEDRYVSKITEWLVGSSPALFSGDVRVGAIEVTQGVQDLNNSVLLVRGKKTFVRVHASFANDMPPVNLTATLKGSTFVDFGNGSLTEVTLPPALTPVNAGGFASISGDPNRGQLDDSFLFELPASWTEVDDLKLTAVIDPSGAVDDPVLLNNVKSVSVELAPPVSLHLRLFDVRYVDNGNIYAVSDVHFQHLESWLRRAFPISDLHVTHDSYVYTFKGFPVAGVVNTDLIKFRANNQATSGENPLTVYYGLVSDEVDFMRGLALDAPSYIASGPAGKPGEFHDPGDSSIWDLDDSYADWYGGHEVAHTRGRKHAEYCGAEGGVSYPYPTGRISPEFVGDDAIYGFDIETKKIYSPFWKDLMTYCPKEWLSDFTYEGIYNFLLQEQTNSANLQSIPQVEEEMFLITALADLDGSGGSFHSVSLELGASSTNEGAESDWSLVLQDSSGAVLESYPIEPHVPSDIEQQANPQLLIDESVPWVEGTAVIQLRHNDQVLDERQISENAPTVAVNKPAIDAQSVTFSWIGVDADGDDLSYTLLYSADNGTSWQTLAVNLASSQLTMDQSDLPGGEGSRLRVIANDGVLNGQGTSAPFAVEPSPPQVSINSPLGNDAFYPAQTVTFEGSAYDNEDGLLADGALQWSSDRDGLLGSGVSLTTAELSTGAHQITLTGTDSDGQQSTANIAILVQNADIEPSPDLSVSPDSFDLELDLNDEPLELSITTRNSSTAPLKWTASSDVSWIMIHTGAGMPAPTAGGETPDTLIITVDPSQLKEGEYQATIRLTPEGADEKQVRITVTISASGIFLPLIRG